MLVRLGCDVKAATQSESLWLAQIGGYVTTVFGSFNHWESTVNSRKLEENLLNQTL